MNDGSAAIAGLLCFVVMVGMPAYFLGEIFADKPVSAAHWAKAEELCRDNDGVATVAANASDAALSRIDVVCVNKAVFEDVKP